MRSEEQLALDRNYYEGEKLQSNNQLQLITEELSKTSDRLASACTMNETKQSQLNELHKQLEKFHKEVEMTHKDDTYRQTCGKFQVSNYHKAFCELNVPDFKIVIIKIQKF